jgi:hypothetical protein
VKPDSLFFGEWWNIPQYDCSKQQCRDFADAQKLRYSEGAGWFFWSFKIEAGNRIGTNSTTAGILRDYVQSVANGYLGKDPSKVFNPDVCKSFMLDVSSGLSFHLVRSF